MISASPAAANTNGQSFTLGDPNNAATDTTGVSGSYSDRPVLAARGFGPQLLAGIFKFQGAKGPAFLVFGYKRGAWWPFVPTGSFGTLPNCWRQLRRL